MNLPLEEEYAVGRALSTGPGPKLYCGLDARSREAVTLEFLPRSALDEQFFLEQTRIALRAKAPNILELLEVRQRADEYVLVYEPVEAQDLASVIVRRYLTVRDASQYVLQVCQGLTFMEAKGVHHPGLRPRHVLLLPGDSGVKVYGFWQTARDRSVTRVEGHDKQSSARTDVEGLGALLYEALAREAPKSVDLGGLCMAPRPLSQVRPDVPQELQRVVERCLQTDQTDSLETIADLAQALEPFVGEPTSMPTAELSSRVTTAEIHRSNQVLPGNVLPGKFQVLDEIGSGGMSRVYSAMHLRLGRLVAIKLLRPEIARHAHFVERSEREGKALAQIEHENVVKVIDVDELSSGEPYMVMEFLEGHDLSNECQLSKDQVVEYVLQACRGLSAVHAAGVIHRDLKPSNLFLTRKADSKPQVKLIDFGIAKLAESLQEGDALTETLSTLGTPSYMSPEQLLSSREVGPTADIWAVGVTLYELLTGWKPYQGAAAQIYHLIQLGERIPMRELRPDLPSSLETIVDRCLSSKPEDRYQSVDELSEALDRAQRGDGDPADDPSSGWFLFGIQIRLVRMAWAVGGIIALSAIGWRMSEKVTPVTAEPILVDAEASDIQAEPRASDVDPVFANGMNPPATETMPDVEYEHMEALPVSPEGDAIDEKGSLVSSLEGLKVDDKAPKRRAVARQRANSRRATTKFGVRKRRKPAPKGDPTVQF